MNNNDLIKVASGYVAGKSISSGVISDLRKQREEIERKLLYVKTEEVLSAEIAKFILSDNKQAAYEYLNFHFNEEIVYVAQNQNDYIYSLETMIQKRRDKYVPFYQKIEMDMPKQLQDITADQLCELLGVENLHIIDSVDGKTTPSKPNDEFDLGLIFRAILIIGLIILMIVLSAS